MGKDAQVTVGADASAVAQAMGSAKESVKDAARSIKDSFGEALKSVSTGLSNVALSQGQINFAAQHQSVRDFEASTARLAIATGRDLGQMRNDIERTGVAIGKRPQEVASWAQAVGKLTFNMQGATEGMKGMAELAALTGRSVDDYRGLAVELGTVGKVSGDTSRAVGLIVAQSTALGKESVGGPAAFAGQVEALSDTISHFAVDADEDFMKVTAAAAVLGRGLSDVAARRVQQTAFGSIAGDPMGWSRFLGRDVTNDNGQVEHPEKVLQQITEKIKRVYGKDSKRMLQLQFGAETGAALNKADWSKASELAGLSPSTKAAEALGGFKGTDAGKREVAEAELAISSRNLMGSASALGRAADALQNFAAHNPILSTLGTGFAGNLLGKIGGKTLEKGLGLGGKLLGAGRALGVGALGAGGALAVAGVAALASTAYAGYKIHSTAQELGGYKRVGRDLVDYVHGDGPAVSHGNAKYAEVQLQNERNLALAKAKAQAKTGARAEDRAVPTGPAPMPSVPGAHAIDYAKLGAAFRDAIRGIGIEVSNASDTPITASVKGASSAAAGTQTGGQ
jgi:hypothetical protein